MSDSDLWTEHLKFKPAHLFNITQGERTNEDS